MNIRKHDYQLQTVPNGKDILEMECYISRNKEYTQTLPLLPTHLKENPDNLKIAHWLLVENFSKWAWLELDIHIDIEMWKAELDSVYNEFVPHPDQPNQLLYESLTMHGISSQHTMHHSNYLDDDNILESQVPYVWTEIADRCPTITNFWKNEFPAEEWYRVRFLKMRSCGYIGVHKDMTTEQGQMWDILTMEFGVNMSITHPEGCETWFDGFGKVPWAPGKFFLHNISKLHWVHNFTPYDRTHMIPMGRIGNRINEFCDLVVKSYLRQTNQTL